MNERRPTYGGQKRIEPQVAWQLEAALGEGPLWFPEEQVLRFVDIKSGHIHAYSPEHGTKTTFRTVGSPSFIVPAKDGSLLVGSQNAVYRLKEDRLTNAVVTIPEPATNRTNDATVDPTGRLWFGTMDDTETQPSGAIWCWDGDHLHAAGPTAVVTNGPAVSSDGKWLYHVDSRQRTVWRHALGSTSELNRGEVFITFAEQDGFPDGIIVDAEGCLWVAMWDGWAVLCYSPRGELLHKIDFPCARVTKIALGGPNLDTAFVTTARTGLSDKQLAGQPLAGSLFTFEAPHRGVAPFSARLPGGD